jgi:DNA primase
MRPLSEIVRQIVVTLRPHSGANYIGLCPFHREQTPSFTVNDDSGSFHCLGCGERGDAAAFERRSREIGGDQ